MFTGWSLGRNVTRDTMFAPHSDSTRKRAKWQRYRGRYSITKTATNKSTYFHNPQNFQLELVQNSFVLLNGCTSVYKRNLSFLAIFHFRVKDRKMCNFFPCCSIQDQRCLLAPRKHKCGLEWYYDTQSKPSTQWLWATPYIDCIETLPTRNETFPIET